MKMEQVGDDESFKGRLFPVIKIGAFWGRGIKLLIVNVPAFSSGFCKDSLRNNYQWSLLKPLVGATFDVL